MGVLITDFQATVAQAFFDMPESKGFLLAGGAALIALGSLIARLTTSTSSLHEARRTCPRRRRRSSHYVLSVDGR